MSGDDKKIPTVTITEEKSSPQVNVRPRTSSSSSSLSLTIKTPRTARFAEATSVNSPIGPTKQGRNPFSGPPIITTTHVSPQPQVGDVGFGYMSSNELRTTSIEVPLTPRTPMRSALKTPGTAGRFLDPRSPTFNEETKLEKEEVKTEKQNAADLVSHHRTSIREIPIMLTNSRRKPRSESASPSSSSAASTSAAPSSSYPCSPPP